MVNSKKIYMLVFFTAVFLLMSAGSASARVEVYNGTITEGDGYQINNYVIDVSDVFVEANTVVFKVYERGELKYDYMMGKNDSVSFDFEDGEVQLKLISMSSGVLPVATVHITMSDYNVATLFSNVILNGGHEFATYSGTPRLEIIKTVDTDSIIVGDTVKVTVSVTNIGDDRAKNVRFSDIKPDMFIPVDTFLEEGGLITMEVGDSRKIFIYIIKATEDGTFVLKPTTAVFSNTAGQTFQASSNTPTITVTKAVVADQPKKTAILELTTNTDITTVARNEKITVAIQVKNTGNASANAVWLEMVVPEDMEYISGDDEIEIIGGVPKIYMDSFGLLQEKEFSYTVEAKTLGTYTFLTKLSYEYDNGVDPGNQKVSTESVTESIYVQKGKYDVLLEQPLYVYTLPVFAIAVIGVWILHRHKQYKF